MKSIFAIGPLAIFVALLIGGCQQSGLQKGISEGVIEYSISFPHMDPDGMMAGMMPDKTTLKFKDGKELNELSAGMGVFKTTISADNSAQEVDYHLSVLGKKLVSTMSPADMNEMFKQKGTMNYVFTNEVDTIAGYHCKKAIVVFDEIDTKEIEIYYTTEISIENANWYNPFKEIPGVMLRYEFDQYDMRMRLEANSVMATSIGDDEFTQKDGFETVMPARINKELSEVMSTFSM